MTNPRLAELTRAFRLPPRLGLSRPRATALTGAGRALVVIAFLLVVGAIASGGLLALEVSRQAERRDLLVNTGVTTTGQITRLWSNSDNRNRVVYTFVVNGETYRGDRKVARARRVPMKVGMPIDVRYVPANPGMNDLGGRPATALPIAFPWVVASGLMAMAAACLVTIHRQRDLLSEGRPAPALVTGRKKEGGPHGSHWSMTYEFSLLNGVVVSGKSSTSKNGPNIGATFCLIYDPERPSRSRAYPFSLVKAV